MKKAEFKFIFYDYKYVKVFFKKTGCEYSWPLNSMVWTVQVHLFVDFFNSKYWTKVGWIHRCETADMEKPHIQRADYKLYNNFQLHS